MAEPARSGTADRPGSDAASGLRRLAAGGVLGLAGGLLAIAVPLALVEAVALAPGRYLVWSSNLLLTGGVLVLAGAILFVLSFLWYRRAFAVLRRTDPRFTAASVLCLVGSLGFLLLVVTAAVFIGDSGGLLACASGAPSHALACLRSTSPLGAYTAVAGFWLGWVGSVGIVLGISVSASRFGRRVLYGAAGAYALLLLALIGPFLSLLVAVPGTAYVLLVAPFLVVVAPALVLSGTRS